MKDKPKTGYWLSPIEIAEELNVSRSSIDRFMTLPVEHPDYLEHIEWGRYRSGAKRRRVSTLAWEAWKERHLARKRNAQAQNDKPPPNRQFNPTLKTRKNFIPVLQKICGDKETVENKRKSEVGTGL